MRQPRINIVVTHEIKEMLEAMAFDDRRSVSQYASIILTKAVREKERYL